MPYFPVLAARPCFVTLAAAWHGWGGEWRMARDDLESTGGDDRNRLLKWADLYARLASVARNPETAARLDTLARRFAAQAGGGAPPA